MPYPAYRKTPKGAQLSDLTLREAFLYECGNAGLEKEKPREVEGRFGHLLIYDTVVVKGLSAKFWPMSRALGAFETEVDTLSRARQTKPMPVFIDDGSDHHLVVESHEPGEEADLVTMTRDQQAALGHDVGAFMARFTRDFKGAPPRGTQKEGKALSAEAIEALSGDRVLSRILGPGLWGAMNAAMDECLHRHRQWPDEIIYHADLKPPNLLVDPGTRSLNCVLDFGFIASTSVPFRALDHFREKSCLYPDAQTVDFVTGHIYRGFSRESGVSITMRDRELHSLAQDLNLAALQAAEDVNPVWIKNVATESLRKLAMA
jgi:serine/threonine protein kinase